MKAIIVPKVIGRQLWLRRAKLRFFALVALAWSSLALIGGTMLWENLAGDEFSGLYLAAWMLIVPEPLFISMAVYFWCKERPR